MGIFLNIQKHLIVQIMNLIKLENSGLRRVTHNFFRSFF